VPEEAEQDLQQDEGFMKKKRGSIQEEKKEDLLDRPDDALTYHEYKTMLKEKNHSLENKQNTNVIKANETDAEPQVRNEEEFILGTEEGFRKHKNKPKQKKSDAKELDVDFRYDDGSTVLTTGNYTKEQKENENEGFVSTLKNFQNFKISN
jgi:hypothetical protein